MSVKFCRVIENKLTCDSGFTLLELLMTMIIAGVLIGIAIPSFISTITSNRLTTNANELVTALNLARSEAIKRGKQVTVRSTNISTSWEGGWDVFVDINGNGAFNDTNSTPCETNADGSLNEDCILRTYGALPNGYSLRTPTSTFQIYSSSGLSTAETFILCSGSGTGMTQRTITVSATGRPSVAVTTGTCP